MSTDRGLQLLPQEHHSFRVVSIPGSPALLIFSLVVLACSIGGYFFIHSYITKAQTQIADIDVQLFAIQKARDTAVEEKLKNFSLQLANVQSLLKSHTTASNMFSEIAHSLDARVRVKSLEADILRDRISIQLYADSFAAVARQVASLYRSTIVKDLSLSRVNASIAGGVEFSIDLMLKK